MSHKLLPDLTASWTFVPFASLEEMQNGSSYMVESESDEKEAMSEAKDESIDVDGAANKRELCDDLSSVSSEVEGSSCSDVDVLEENVGPDHVILQMSLAFDTSFSSYRLHSQSGVSEDSSDIPSELETTQLVNSEIRAQPVQTSKTTDNLSLPGSEVPLCKQASSTEQVNAEIRYSGPCESEEPLPGVSGKLLDSNSQPVQSCKTTDILSQSKSEVPLHEQGSLIEQVNAEIRYTRPCELAESSPKVSVKLPDCSAEALRSSKSTDDLSLSHPKSEEPLQEQVSLTELVNADILGTRPCGSEVLLPEFSVKPPDHRVQPVRSSKATFLPFPKFEAPLQQWPSEQKSMNGEDKPVEKFRKHRLEKQTGMFRACLCMLMCELVVCLFLACLLTIRCLISLDTDKMDLPDKTVAQLESVQDETLKCLGLQYLTAMEDNHYGMLSNVCVNDSVAWKSNFEKLLESKALKTLMYEVRSKTVRGNTEDIKTFLSGARNDVQGIKFDLILRQMEYLQLLDPVEEDNHLKDKDSAVPVLFSEKLEKQKQLLGQLHQFIDQLKLRNIALESLGAELEEVNGAEDSVDPVALKLHRLELENVFLSNHLQHMMDQFESGKFLGPEHQKESSNLNNDASHMKRDKMKKFVWTQLEKINSLLLTNDELRRMYSDFYNVKPGLEDGDKKETFTAEKETTSEHSGFTESGTKNRESLFEELLILHQELVGEFMEVRNWNEMFAEETDGLHSSHSHKSNGSWPWLAFKHSFDGIHEIFCGAQLYLTQMRKIVHDVPALLHKYIGELRSSDVFRGIPDLWNSTVNVFYEMNAVYSCSPALFLLLVLIYMFLFWP